MNNRKLTSEERRSRRRLPPHLDRRITCRKVTNTEAGGEPANTAITAVDISRTGLCLLVSESFDPGQAVLIAYRDHHYNRSVELTGTVQWATPDGADSFRIGIELEEELSPHQMRLLTRLTTQRLG
jgi:hypothetical protein